MKWIACRSDFVNETYICLTLARVMVFGFMTDLIGIHSIFGAFVFGLVIPKGGEFAERLVERIKDFVSDLLLPLYFASSGLKADVSTISGAKAWGLLGLVITTASVCCCVVRTKDIVLRFATNRQLAIADGSSAS